MRYAGETRARTMLWGLAAVSEFAYALVALADQSLHVEEGAKHSLLAILALFAVAFAAYLAAIRVAVADRSSRGNLLLILAAAVVFRATLLFSSPIEEIDLYRYLWDGRATLAGVSPFRYSPHQVVVADADEGLPEDLSRLRAARDESATTRDILARIHFPELPTIYPPVSQAVFALAAWCTPRSATVATHLVVMRGWFVLFDLLTLVVVLLLLRRTGKPLAWSIAYAWCPLAIKEFANSGHLDSLALFWSTLAFYLAVRALFPRAPAGSSGSTEPAPRPILTSCLAAAALAVGIGGKLYPVVFAPLLMVAVLRRLGWRAAIATLGVGATTSALVLWPMLPRGPLDELPLVRMEAAGADGPPLPPPELGTAPRDPSQGLRAFLSEWEMNDFLFLLLVENVRPTADLPRGEVPWFSVVPESCRRSLAALVRPIVGVERDRAPFFASRIVAGAAFVGVQLWLAVRRKTYATADAFLEAGFLTVAWFWLLLPAQNPWYWTWALPLLPFAKGRAWLATSGLAMMYYLRFWFTWHFENAAVAWTIYRGPQFFDYVVTWIEFGPFFVWLAVDCLHRVACPADAESV